MRVEVKTRLEVISAVPKKEKQRPSGGGGWGVSHCESKCI